jgi:hypothetical protein
MPTGVAFSRPAGDPRKNGNNGANCRNGSNGTDRKNGLTLVRAVAL